jgi:proline iminopeptidase
MMKSKMLLLVMITSSIFWISCQKERNIVDPGNLVPKTVNEDPNLPAIVVNGARLHSQAFGPVDSTLVMVLHGGPGGSYQYMLNCKSLADKGFRVVFYDQIGSGLSQRFSEKWYSNFGSEALNKIFYDELRAVITYYKTKPNQKVVLLGDSWGGILAAGYTGKYANEISGLIVGEPGGLNWQDINEYIGKSRSFKLFSETLNDALYFDQFITGKENQHEILDYKFGLMTAKNDIVGEKAPDIGNNKSFYRNSRSGAEIFEAMIELGDKYLFNFSAGLNQYTKKTLFIYSSNNTVYTDGWAQKISSVFSNKEILKVQGVGHSGFFDQKNTWSSTTEPKVVQFLKTL